MTEVLIALLQHPVLPLGLIGIVGILIILFRAVRRAEDSDNATVDTLVEDVLALTARVEAVEKKQTEHSNKLSNLALKGMK